MAINNTAAAPSVAVALNVMCFKLIEPLSDGAENNRAYVAGHLDPVNNAMRKRPSYVSNRRAKEEEAAEMLTILRQHPSLKPAQSLQPPFAFNLPVIILSITLIRQYYNETNLG